METLALLGQTCAAIDFIAAFLSISFATRSSWAPYEEEGREEAVKGREGEGKKGRRRGMRGEEARGDEITEEARQVEKKGRGGGDTCQAEAVSAVSVIFFESWTTLSNASLRAKFASAMENSSILIWVFAS
jgi:hypothetical protein